MIQIGKTIISNDLIEKKFSCDISSCKGACCVQGESGAPLEPEEIEILKKCYPQVKPLLRNESVITIEKYGVYVIDSDGDMVTPLNDGKECSYVIFENDIAFCAIEKAHLNGNIDFQKPVSCHLYPVRHKKYRDFIAINYHEWEICKPAVVKGSYNNISVYSFVKRALIRRFGENWFSKLETVAKNV
jgi:hypothetical protein